jgi:Bacterial RNA polymerase, alpha chain C terminal domain/Sigma-70, region 4
MKKDWLEYLIIDSKLIDASLLSEMERHSVIAYIKEKKTLVEIGKEIELTDERVRQLIENGVGKVLLTTKELLAKSKYLQSLYAENQMLKTQLKELRTESENQLEKTKTLNVRIKHADILIDDIRFSVRANKILTILNVKSTKELNQLTRQNLISVPGSGMKTIEEIIRVAEEFGIIIK